MSVIPLNTKTKANGSPPGRPAPRAGRAFTDLLEVASTIGKERPWLFEGAIEGRPMVVWSAGEKSGKSWAMLDACVAVTTGGSWLGEFAAKRTGPAVYLDSEYGDHEFARRLTRVCRARGVTVRDVAADLHHLYATDLLLDRDPDNEPLRWLLREIVRIDPVLVVVDPWQNFLPGNQNDSADTLAALGIIAEIRNKTNATFALVHHLNRAGTTAGSRALLGRCDLLFEGSDTVEPRYKARGRAIRFADPVRNRFSLDIEHTDDDDDSVATTTVGLRWESDEGRPPRGEDKRPAPERVRAFLAGHEGESFTTKQLAEELSLSWKLVDQTLGDLLRSQRVSKGQRVVRGQERAVWQARVSLDEGLEALG